MKILFKFVSPFSFILILATNIKANDISYNYIEQYKAIAISEMQRTGIPASIKLAQGMLESNKGQSELAMNANNHFGIKCGRSWTGNGYRLEDDDYNDRGELIKSCFRVYKDAYQSYINHSDLLSGPRGAYRYGHLFDLDPKDYMAWAKGLRKSGYATDPKYPDKLIHMIEKYHLDQYDQPIENLARIEYLSTTISENSMNTDATKSTINWVTNDDPASWLMKQERNKKNEKEDYHIVLYGETAIQISRKYGITEKDLFAFNRIPMNSHVKVGSKLRIDGYLHWGDRAEYSEVGPNHEENLLFANETVESFY